jgi:hypothetical protein
MEQTPIFGVEPFVIKPSYYRAKADECERMAARTLSPDDKARWIKVAEVWLHRARSASERFEAMEHERGRHQGPKSRTTGIEEETQ